MTAEPIAIEFDPGSHSAYGPWATGWRRLRRTPLALAAAGVLAILVVVSVLAAIFPAVERHDPSAQSLEELHAPPSLDHPFGTDNLGRDTWARAWAGLRISLKVGLGVELLVVAIALVIGSAAAMGGRWVDGALMRFADVMYAFPDLLAVLVLRSVFSSREWPILGTGDPQIPGLPGPLLQVILAIALVAWVTLARLVRAQLMALRSAEFVVAAQAMGASPVRLVVVHMLPNIAGPIIVAATFGIPAAMFAEAVLGFIGFGLPPPTASLGTLVADGYTYFRVNTWMIVVPSAAIALLMLCFTFLGDGLRDALDPRSDR